MYLIIHKQIFLKKGRQKKEDRSAISFSSEVFNVNKMSWDSYIENLIGQSKNQDGKAQIDRACIISLEDGKKWTSDNHPNVSCTTTIQSLLKLLSQ